jgi:hypothetical protein
MADGAGVEEIAFVPGTIVQAVLNSSQNGVNLHSVVVRYTSTYLQDVASGDSAEEVMESLPSTGPEWVTTFEEAWHASAEKIMPEFVRSRSAVWAGVSVAGRSVSPPPGPVGLGGASAGASKEIFKRAPIERDETIAALMDGLVVSDHDFDKAIHDIKVQRISGARMMALSLALVSGHVHPMGDSADLRFGSDMRLCPLIKQQRKAGVLSLDQIITSKSRRELSLHYTRLAKEYSDRQLIEEATLVSQFWAETTSAFEGDDTGLFNYLNEWNRTYTGRGIPKLLDTDIILRTRKADGGGMSASDAKDLKEAVKAAAGKVNASEQKASALEKRLARLEASGMKEGGGKKTCFICGGDHLAKNCPSKEKDKDGGKKKKEDPSKSVDSD